MNGKKSKLLRKTGSSSKASKRLYNAVSHDYRGIAGDILELRAERPMEPLQKMYSRPHPSGATRKFRRGYGVYFDRSGEGEGTWEIGRKDRYEKQFGAIQEVIEEPVMIEEVEALPVEEGDANV